MLRDLWSMHLGKIAISAAIASTLVYLAMIFVTLAHLEAVAGSVPFDMRPLGYNPPEARTLLEALGVDGRTYYIRYQISLDMFYPALLALTLISTIIWFGRRLAGTRLVRLGVVITVCAAVLDYSENAGIVAMITIWPNTSEFLVRAVSAASVGKAACTTLSVLLTLTLGCMYAYGRKAPVRS